MISNVTVVVIDDELSVRRSLTRLLASAGYEVITFSSAEDFLALSSVPRPACLVTDVRMPGMTGLELCQRLRKDKQHHALPILFLTGHSSSFELVQAFEAGADDFVSKPFRAPELRARVLGLLRRVSGERRAAG